MIKSILKPCFLKRDISKLDIGPDISAIAYLWLILDSDISAIAYLWLILDSG